jgi:hypothetical protein
MKCLLSIALVLVMLVCLSPNANACGGVSANYVSSYYDPGCVAPSYSANYSSYASYADPYILSPLVIQGAPLVLDNNFNVRSYRSYRYANVDPYFASYGSSVGFRDVGFRHRPNVNVNVGGGGSGQVNVNVRNGFHPFHPRRPNVNVNVVH